MLGFSPLATIPLADILLNASTAVTGQSLSLTQNSVDSGVFVTINVSGFSLALAQGTLDLITDINLTLDSQTITTAQNTFSITADSVYLLLKQVDMVMSVNSVDFGIYASVDVTGQEIASTLTSVTPYPVTPIYVTGQEVSTTQHSVSATAEGAVVLDSQSLHLALHSMRMWNKINTAQTANWTPVNTAQSPGWTEIET